MFVHSQSVLRCCVHKDGTDGQLKNVTSWSLAVQQSGAEPTENPDPSDVNVVW